MKESMSTAPRRLNKHELERAYFKHFQAAYALPPGLVSYGDKPDVILTGIRKIGIEITNLYLEDGSNPYSEQRQKHARAKIAAQAQNKYHDCGGRDVNLTMSFNAKHPISRERRRGLVSEIAELARNVETLASGPLPTTIPELATVWLHEPGNSADKWRIQNVYDVRLLSTASLVAIVKAKEAKAIDYTSCDAYWLLVVVDGFDTAQEQEIRVDDLHVPSELFERIIIYKPLFEHVVDVEVSAIELAWRL